MVSFTTFFTALVAGSAAVYAVPSPVQNGGLSLSEDHIIVTGDDGRQEIITKEAWKAEVAKGGWEYIAPAAKKNTTSVAVSRSLEKRGCKYHDIYAITSDQTFMNWDVAMSSAVHANNESAYTYIQLSSGYTIENSFSVTTSIGTGVPIYASVSVGITVEKSWSSTSTAGYAYYIKAGKYGIVVSNPWVRRVQGIISSGCAGRPSTVTDWSVDSYTSSSYGDLSWVTGTIGLCTSDVYPIPYCEGSGFHT